MKKLSIYVLMIIALLISGCNFPFFGGNAEEEQVAGEFDIVATQVVQTLQAIEQQAPTPLPELPTQTPQTGAELPAPPVQDTVAVPASPANSPNCLIAGTVSETIPDNTHFAPGDVFTKTWTIINSGTCEWPSNYQFVFASGDQMGAYSPAYLNLNVPAGNFLDVNVPMTAPTTPGTYQGNWEFQTENGVTIASFWVLIIVDDVDFAITTANLSADAENHAGSCPYTYNFNAKIAANMLGTATYYFEYEDASKSSTKSVDFDASGTEAVTGSRELTASGTYTTRIYIDDPNHQYFDTLNFTLTCN